MADDKIMTEAEELTKLLKEAIAICREDRKMALDNHNDFKKQLEAILDQGMEGSEEYKLEREVNQSLKLVYESGARMEKVIESITRIMAVQMNNESRERVATSVFGGAFGDQGKKFVRGQANLQELLQDQRDEDN